MRFGRYLPYLPKCTSSLTPLPLLLLQNNFFELFLSYLTSFKIHSIVHYKQHNWAFLYYYNTDFYINFFLCSHRLFFSLPLSTNFTKWSNKLKHFVGCCRRIVWVCLPILWDWHLKGYNDNIILYCTMKAFHMD